MAGKAASSRSQRTALLIGGGAPNSSLMAGALVAFIEHNMQFDVISASGAGALMGLLYQAPKDGDAIKALKAWSSVGVSNAIYDVFPVNYKVFMKPGPAAEWYRAMLAQNPITRPIVSDWSGDGLSGVVGDWLRLILATFSPTDLSSRSLGLCAHLPFAEQVIDFSAIAKIKPEFYINAYNVTRSEMEIWGKHEITPAHLRCAFSFPMIYPPFHLDGNDYIEGAAIDTLNFKALVSDDDNRPGCERDVDTLVIFDILGADKLIRTPRNLYDAWVQSIITPLVEIAKDDIRLFELCHNVDQQTGKPKRKLLKVDLMGSIPHAYWPEIMDWSNSNLKYLYEVGYQAGVRFCQEHPELLPQFTPPRSTKQEALATMAQ
ncbi:patatin-like phospholipase family protein [Chitinivorax sp. B]|uniref:patatin-like phospholipase family protein n=1 Tax=Chitinivorax sp. B TaxID=2502235 RepID=UPI0010F89379|nr:patatin-like phospholipase family protein [Chitinivorax sp. B]